MATQSKKVLIGEDEKPIAKAFELKLQKAGLETKVVSNGEEVLAALEQETFDLILLDLMMPKVDGFAVLAELKKRSIATPVIVTSNLSQEEDIKKAKELGAKDYFVKSNTAISDVVQYVKQVLKS